MKGSDPSRRGLLRLVAGAVGSGILSAQSLAQVAPDRGLGGTGAVPGEDQVGDRGIGGTGVVGTIRRFGSIVVNDMRIAYGKRTSLTIDGRPAPLSSLRLGQMVRVLAEQRRGILFTRHIAVTSEVAGRIAAVSGETMTVLGQTIVFTDALGRRGWRTDDHVAVSGLRRPAGVVRASRIDRVSDGGSQIAGPLVVDDGGVATIGGLRIEGVDHQLRDQRVVVIGTEQVDRFVADHVGLDADAIEGLAAARLSIETLIEKMGRTIRIGSALAKADAIDLGALPGDGLFRAIVTARITGSGAFAVEGVRVAERVDSPNHAATMGRPSRAPPDRGPPGPGPEHGSQGMGPGGPPEGGPPGHPPAGRSAISPRR